MNRLSIYLLLISLLQAAAFAPPKHFRFTTPSASQSNQHPPTQLNAKLSPRQLQFWQDVSVGLLPIEKFYAEKNQSLDRIWDFCERAKSGVAADALGEGHEPSEEHVDGLTAKVCDWLNVQFVALNAFACAVSDVVLKF